MADYIERQTAIDKINERQRTLIYCFGFENDMVKIMDIARSIIIAMPSADVQPHQLTEEDLNELRHRFGKDVECVVRDMISGKDERWQNG